MNKTRVLVAEYQPAISSDLEGRLRRLGYEVAGRVDTGEAAIRSAKDVRPDVVLMDVEIDVRLLDYEHGTIALDGMEIRTLPRKYVRGQFGVVMQEPFLYSKTLKDNIRLGRYSSSDGEIVDSATIAQIHESIESFDKKYDTLVGERGVTLSGGQRQRVAIARAILKDAPVLILDDALSAVDTHTETLILDALKRRRGRHTTIVVAHRLSTLMHADQIAVLEQGRVTQLGTHAELIDQPQGLYARLWQIQTALEEDLSRELGDRSTDRDPDQELVTQK